MSGMTVRHGRRSRMLFSTAIECGDLTDSDVVANEEVGRSPSSRLFDLNAPYEPTGDQPAAIAHLVDCIERNGDKYAMLKGSTGTGKTFAVANLISKLNRPALVLCHNKTLASQLCRELRAFFPNNAVELFISYYNHYRPESYKEATGKYMAKKSSVNADIDVLRHCATRSLVTRQDVIVVASVSCIFGIGLPEEYLNAAIQVTKGDAVPSDWIGQSLELSLLYTYNDQEDARFERGMYQMVTAAGGTDPLYVVTLWPPHEPFPMQLQLAAIRRDDGGIALVFRSIRLGTKTGFREVDSCKIFPVRYSRRLLCEMRRCYHFSSIKLM
jgi:Type III restriction enzyme, res subunit